MTEKKIDNAISLWDFRVSENELTFNDIMGQLKDVAKHFIFQLEQGDSGYRHFQGRMSLIKKRRHAEKHLLLKLFTKWQPNYLEPTTNPEYIKTSFSYVMKIDTRLEGPWTDVDVPKEVYIPRQYRNIEVDQLYPFQQTIWNTIQNDACFNSRQINLIYCKGGNKGKSTIAHLSRLKANSLVIPAIINDAKELVQVACDMCMDTQNRNPKAIFIDMPRAINKDRLYGIYSAIEVIKDGYLYDVRHHFKSWDIDSPHVWVFTNTMPQLEMLSQDRWNIFTIDESKCLIPIEEDLSHQA